MPSYLVVLVFYTVYTTRSARVVFSVGASQEHFWSSLTEDCEVPWNYVTVFALNEYAPLSVSAHTITITSSIYICAFTLVLLMQFS